MSAPATSAKPQPERERILVGMVTAMAEASDRHAQESQGDQRDCGPPPLRLLAEAALRSLEAPRRGVEAPMSVCSCGHSGYAKDGPHAPGCPLAE